MSDDLLKAVQVLKQFTAAATRQEYFQKLRDTDKSEVFDNFLSIISAEDPTINKTTGRKHTVDSIVSELHARVGLDAVLRKHAVDEPLALSRKAKYMASDGKLPDEQTLKGELTEFSRKYFLERDHGLSAVETMIEEFKSQPNGMRIIEAFGRERVRDMLRDIVDQYPKDNIMPPTTGNGTVTMPAADQNTSGQPEQANIGMGGTSSSTSR